MNLNRRHYDAAADIIRKLPQDRATLDLAETLSGAFRRDNRFFDEDAFFTACGIGWETPTKQRPRLLPRDYPPEPHDARD